MVSHTQIVLSEEHDINSVGFVFLKNILLIVLVWPVDEY